MENHDQLLKRYNQLTQQELDQEFYRIASVPNARTNIKCLTEMTALMQVYQEKGIAMPNREDVAQRQTRGSGSKPQTAKAGQSKSGCGAAIFIVAIGGLVLDFILK